MIVLLLILLLLLAHLKIAIMQRTLASIIDVLDTSAHTAAHTAHTTHTTAHPSDKHISPEAYVLSSEHAVIKTVDLDPKVLHAFHGLKASQKKEYFLSIQSLGLGVAFELFWNACHESNDLVSAKYFQDALLELDKKTRLKVCDVLKKYKDVNVDVNVEPEASETINGPNSVSVTPTEEDSSTGDSNEVLLSPLNPLPNDMDKLTPKPKAVKKKGKDAKPSLTL